MSFELWMVFGERMMHFKSAFVLCLKQPLLTSQPLCLCVTPGNANAANDVSIARSSVNYHIKILENVRGMLAQ